ncbi:MAG: hypothetical protein Q9226_001733 [Calogaya cf. arnoldii]
MALRVLTPAEQNEINYVKATVGPGATTDPLDCAIRLDENIVNKGKGYRANHRIDPGTLIHAERPLFTVEATKRINKDDQNRINDAVLNLSIGGLRSFRRLAQPFPRRTAYPDKERFLANNFQMRPTEEGRQLLGIFLKASRFNHSCIPNAWWNWNPHYTNPGRAPAGALTVYAIKIIRANEEIVVNYHNEHAYWSAADRQRELLRDYNFRCDCLACQVPILHDARRLKMYAHDDNARANQGNNPTEKWERSQSLLQLVEYLSQEGLEYPHKADVYGHLAEMHVDEMNQFRNLNNLSEAWSQHGKARENFHARLKAEIVALGEDSQETRDTLQVMARVL